MKEDEIFAEVVSEKSPQKRAQLILKLCENDHDLRRRVENLVAAHQQPDTFFADPVGAQDERRFAETNDDCSPAAGTQIGPYKLLQQIGEGGMGLVFMAEQTTPVKRRVALKVIKPGMDSRQIIARFEAERQALAMMNHPNIAKVFDAGTTADGRPYFVMELVNGKTITEYCDEEKLTTRERLKLFTTVCLAVQHAHQKGVIHRDIKPGNILITEFDGIAVAKVIDFGIAKATGPSLTEKTLFTEFGQVVGTIEYMSPEQARRNQLDVDTRTDVYSLGVVLYKLLTGETPFESERFKKAAWDEMLKIIREETPKLPSIKVGTSDSLDQIANHRSVTASRLPAQIKGDLDWIVTKSLEKNRDHRYQTASAMADDLGRHLNQQTVLAAPSNSIARFRNFVRRNPRRFWTYVTVAIIFCYLVYLGQRASDALKIRNAKIINAIEAAQLTLNQAENSVIGDESFWNSAELRTERISDLLNNNEIISRDVRESAEQFLDHFRFKRAEREIARQIEDVVIRGASQPDMKSWKKMEVDIRTFFKHHGFDLDNEDPLKIGQQIHDHRSAVMWSDLLELWIGTRGQMGGPDSTRKKMQPWAEAIYLADEDPIRTGIRKFIYEPSPNREKLDSVMEGVELKELLPRTIAWLGTCYAMIRDQEECDRVLQTGLRFYPRDVMLTHDYAITLFFQKRYQEAARMFHRCLVLRDDVPGLWISLGRTLEKLDEKDAAQRAFLRAEELKTIRNEN